MPHEIAAPLAEENLGLVHLCANRFRGRGVEYEELYSAGCVGLLKAVRAFDSSRGVQFSTYAVPVILGEIKRVFRDGGAIHVSRGLRERAMRLQKLQEVFEQTHGRTPTLSELSVLADCTVEACAQALCVADTAERWGRGAGRTAGHSGGSAGPPDRRSPLPAAGDGTACATGSHAAGTSLFSGTDTNKDGADFGDDTGAGVTARKKASLTTERSFEIVNQLNR